MGKLGRYEVLNELGKGAMGVVYLAKDPVIGRLVAIKTIKTSQTGDDDSESREFRERFVREAQTAGILSHPNIVTIHDIGEDAESRASFIAMEYIEGRNLKSLLTEKTKFAWDEIADLVAQIAEALDYAHRKGIIHRDIKPANIILTTDGEGEDHRLRDRQDRLVEPDDDRAVPRHAQLHVARAGLRRAGGRPQRHLLARRRALRAADESQALPGRQPDGDLLQDRPRGLHAAGRAVVGRAAGVQPHRRAGDGQGPWNRYQRGKDLALALYQLKAHLEEQKALQDLGTMVSAAENLPTLKLANLQEIAAQGAPQERDTAVTPMAGSPAVTPPAMPPPPPPPGFRDADAEAPRRRGPRSRWPRSRADRGHHEHAGRGRGPSRGFVRERGAAAAAAASSSASAEPPAGGAGAQDWKKLAKAEVNPKWFWRVVVRRRRARVSSSSVSFALFARSAATPTVDAGCGPRAGSPREPSQALEEGQKLFGEGKYDREPREIPPGPRAQPQQRGGPQVRADGGERRQEPAGRAGRARADRRDRRGRPNRARRGPAPTKPRRRPRRRWRSMPANAEAQRVLTKPTRKIAEAKVAAEAAARRRASRPRRSRKKKDAAPTPAARAQSPPRLRSRARPPAPVPGNASVRLVFDSPINAGPRDGGRQRPDPSAPAVLLQEERAATASLGSITVSLSGHGRPSRRGSPAPDLPRQLRHDDGQLPGGETRTLRLDSPAEARGPAPVAASPRPGPLRKPRRIAYKAHSPGRSAAW